ncbi:MAG: acyl-CoA desaturase [Acidimicrobiia bacterium]|nr:acyl-CoA desaturase [Acidimicrobiia bacterium]MDH5288513.1 acyl-CoA desaturase [Acidimicrobiia bacterium]
MSASSDLTIDRPSIASLWRSVLPTAAEEARARRRLHLKAVVIGLVLVVSYAVLVISNWALPIRLAGAIGLVVAVVAVATGILHDANHGSFSRRRWLNRTLSYTADALGTSSWLWRIQHNTLHHGNTNVVGFDTDIALAPLARLAPTQRWRPWYRAQHIYVWPIYGFLAIKNLLISDTVALVTRRIDAQPLRRPVTAAVVARVVAGKLVHVGWAIVLPLLFNPWWAVLAFYLACSWVVGFVLAVTFQLAHCVDRTEFPAADNPRRGDDFVRHQLRTTCDIDSPLPVVGPFYRWIVGGLDHQIEHHLAPRLPHTVYPALAERFREQCRVHGIAYRFHPGVWSAISSHARWLRQMGMQVTPLPVTAGPR